MIEIGYFDPAALPAPLLAGHSRQIADALGDANGRVWSHEVNWPFEPGMTRQELYAMRDRSGLSRQQFYTQMLLEVGEGEMTLEVEGQ